jgi:hypothetical protein
MRSCGGLRATRSSDISGEGSRATSASRLPRNLPRDELAKHPVLMAVSNAADYSRRRAAPRHASERHHHAATSTIIRQRRWRIMSHALSVQIWSRVEIDYVHCENVLLNRIWNGRTNYTHSLIMYTRSGFRARSRSYREKGQFGRVNTQPLTVAAGRFVRCRSCFEWNGNTRFSSNASFCCRRLELVLFGQSRGNEKPCLTRYN